MKTSRWFPHRPGAVPEARHFVGSLLDSAPSATRQDVEVMVSELATNCIRHTSSTFTVSVELSPDAVRVDVTDDGGGTPAVGRPPPSQPTGRGLQIVEMLADDWGIEVGTGSAGKTVWFARTLRAESAVPVEAPTRDRA